MKIRILGWESEGLRCPDVKILLTNESNPHRVSLIQMPNGTGKTTTLSLLKAALTGVALDWDQEKVVQFRRRGEDLPSGMFLVRLSIDDKPLTFEMTLDFVEGGVKYRTTALSSGGVSDGWKPPSEVKRFLTERFVDLFVFDGELSNKMLDPHQARAEDAIDALCQLELLDKLLFATERSWQRLTKDKGAKTTSGLAQWKSKEKQLSERLQTLKEKQKEAKDELATTKSKLSTIDKTIKDTIAKDEKLKNELATLEREEARAETAKNQATEHAMRAIRKPHFLHESLQGALSALKEHLDKVKLPDTTSRQFFVELAESDFCVCDRPIGEVEKKVILARAGKYLGEDISGVLNSVKQDIAVQVDASDAEEEPLNVTLDILKQAEKDYLKAQTERQGHEAKLIEQADEEVKKLNVQFKKLEERDRELSITLEELERQPLDVDDEKSTCIAAIAKKLEAAQTKIADITGTVDLRTRTEIIKKIASSAKVVARDRLRKELVVVCNLQLDKILSADPVQISEINKSIVLRGQQEASAGQTLAVGYTFLTAVLSRGVHEFPLIVDSPAGPLDDQVRREVGKMIPSLCDQFVAFTISTERSDFLPALEESVHNDIRYLTLFRKTDGTKHLLDSLPKTGVTQTDNAVLVEGREYFTKFSLANDLEE